MPSPTLKIRGARFILTIDPERRILQDSSLLIEEQRIVQMDEALELEGIEEDRIMNASEMVVTPRFCNGYIHISYSDATRGIFPDDLNLRDYLANAFKW